MLLIIIFSSTHAVVPMPAVPLATHAVVPMRAVPFALSDVSLDAGSLFGVAQTRNLQYVLGLNSSQLLCQYTSAANLTKCEGDGHTYRCPMPGGEGRPVCNVLPQQMTRGGYFGHYLGHYLSAAAFLINGTGDAAVQTKVDSLLKALRATMDAWQARYGDDHDGYLFPLDPIVFHYLHTNSAGCDRHLCGLYSVPYYTLHKMMAGLLDLYTHAGSAEAFKMVLRMAAWVTRHASRTVASGGQELWQQVLATEWGGMNEVLFNLYALTGEPEHLSTGRLFNHWAWSAPLALGVDDLGGNHANTHIPEVLGNAVGFELTANRTDAAIALGFFAAVTRNHSWATGGSNEGEYWGASQRMGNSLSANTEESCTQYNILKIARHLFMWSANASLADFYEKAMLNGILGNQKREARGTSFIYMLPLGGTGMGKRWGDAEAAFPCCWGTLSEQLAKLPDSIYFQSPPTDAAPPALFVNLFVASTVRFVAGGVTVVQRTAFPTDPHTTTTLTIGALDAPEAALVEGGRAPGHFILHLRVPGWATQGPNQVLVNGQPSSARAVAGSYLALERTWAVGDTLVAHFPMAVHASPLEDAREAFNATVAYMYGPLVLGGLVGSRWFVPAGDTHEPASFLTRNSSSALDFEAKGQLFVPAPASASAAHPLRLAATTMRLVPLYQIVDERYTVYFDQSMRTIPYSSDGATLPSSTAADFAYSDGASGASGPADASCSGGNIRTGGPGGVARISFSHPLLAPGYVVDAFSMSFRYVTGYTPAPGRNASAPVVKVLLCDMHGTPLATLFESDALGNYSYDHFTGYSPPIEVSASKIGVPNDDLIVIVLEVTNNQRNLQIPLDDLGAGFNATVEWKAAPTAHGHHHHAYPHEHDVGHVHASPLRAVGGTAAAPRGEA